MQALTQAEILSSSTFTAASGTVRFVMTSKFQPVLDKQLKTPPPPASSGTTRRNRLEGVGPQLLEEYRRAGGAARTIFELPDKPTDAQIISVLSAWLGELETRWPGEESSGREMARLMIVRTLGHKTSRKSTAIPALITQFDHAKILSERTRWAAGNALYDIPAGKEYFDDLATIATDRAFGRSRGMVVTWLGKSRHPDATTVALGLIDDESVEGNALEALAKMRVQGARKQIEPFLNSPKARIRQLAKRILDHDQS
ncbi:HEAT repeat domain-containing protein [Nocardia sp. AG03]|uniref:HEAT repeat domain-containing protein n=1 Tax=Nocardia sp. AG03 TaxID=3025312 RepID=UPI0024181AD3|nr:HEAT repeat domain-containing protein [Nocardia sp. AG03]